MSDPTLSIIISTARASYGSLIGLEQTHLFEPCFRSLETQTCKDFELVIGDCLAPYRNLEEEIKSLGNWSFKWRVVPIIGGQWQPHRLWSLQYAFNVCAVYSDGLNLMFSGDAAEYPPTVIAQTVSWLKQGYQPQPMVIYKLGNKVRKTSDVIDGWESNGKQGWEPGQNDEFLFGKSDTVRDSRFQFVEEAGGWLHGPDVSWAWFYANATIDRQSFFNVLNGFDENCDGEKSLGDSEIGSRIQMAGLWNPAFDTNMYTFEHSHKGCDERVLRSGLRAIRSNYDLIYVLRSRKQIRANCYKLTDAEFDTVLNKTQYCPHYAPSDPEYKFQQFWKENQPMRDYGMYWRARRKKEGYAYLSM